MSYTVKKDNNKFKIVEKDSKEILLVTPDEKKARNICRSLNLGSGFGNFIPYFFYST